MIPQETDPKQQLRDLSNGMALTISAIFAVNRTVQIWSRIPGTTGPWFFGWLLPIGMCIQGYYYQVNVSTTREDVMPFGFVVGLTLIWLCIHGVKHSLFRQHGLNFHSYEPGSGVLYGMAPRWSLSKFNLASDLFVAAGLSLCLHLLGCPILGQWYAFICVWLPLGQLWIHARDSHRRRKWMDAQIEAQDWSEQLKG